MIEDEDKTVLTRRRFKHFNKDINRDFPYLVDQDKCMETIGARVINELFIHHTFSLALSLHGGMEAFTYPFGAPNHVKNKNMFPSVPMSYTETENGRTRVEAKTDSMRVANDYRMNKYEQQLDLATFNNSESSTIKSTNAPDYNAMTRILQINF